MIAGALWGSIGLAAAALAVGYGLTPWWPWSVLPLGFGLLWLAGHWRNWAWIDSLGLAAFGCATAAGVWFGLGSSSALLTMVASLSAWDLGHFRHFLLVTQRVEAREAMERRHLGRLLVVDALSLVLGFVALRIRLQLRFAWALLLGVLLVLALGQMMGLLRREEE